MITEVQTKNREDIFVIKVDENSFYKDSFSDRLITTTFKENAKTFNKFKDATQIVNKLRKEHKLLDAKVQRF